MTDLPEILLVPVDGSRNSNAAAAYAARLAERIGAQVRLLYAFPKTPVDMLGVVSEGPSRRNLEYFASGAFEKLRDDSAEAAFKAAVEAMGNITVNVDKKVISGEPGEAILEHATGLQGGMIVMGRRGLSHFKEILMGSTTQRVLHHAKCPVLVVR
ncbi:MAG: universal stress protein [Ectothiorhodospiraceae bacterium]|nr:universal stress protein [Ectothiorhodospiraceae bacterium]MCH8505233.1 universal stress protein [Ectothiorhodospiraceae bacterium]